MAELQGRRPTVNVLIAGSDAICYGTGRSDGRPWGEADGTPALPPAGGPVPAGRTPATPRLPRPPPVYGAMAAQGEGDINRAAETAGRDPGQVAAQRTVANGVDRIVTSRSPAAVRRFFQRTLPSFATMECAFRDPASAEHVRMQLRPMNALLPVAERMSEADLTRYERELRCPRE